MHLDDRVAAGDLTLFDAIVSETHEGDRRSFLAVQHAVARYGAFSYLEIGSHLGGTLQPFVADPRCRRIVSIDPRPAAQPDDRGWTAEYEDNSTERMLYLLADVPNADTTKISTIERSTEDIPPGSIARPDLCLIDGEHTYAAALRDARFCRTVLQGAGVILFHDRWVIERAIRDFVAETPGPLKAYPLQTNVFAVELGAGSALTDPAVAAEIKPRGVALWKFGNRLRAGRLFLAAAHAARRLRDARA